MAAKHSAVSSVMTGPPICEVVMSQNKRSHEDCEDK